MINIAICDDDEKDITLLEEVITDVLKNKDINFVIDKYENGITLIDNWKAYDIVFLDIEMMGENGLDIGNKIKKRNIQTKIIYVTNYDLYYAEAFSIHAFQYILKPINSKKIADTLYEAINYVNGTSLHNFVTLSDMGDVINIKSSEIIYFEFVQRKVKLTTGNKEYFIKTSLKRIYEKVEDWGFGVPHKAFIVNFLKITNLKQNSLIMSNGDDIPIAQKRASEFRKQYLRFLNELYKYF